MSALHNDGVTVGVELCDASARSRAERDVCAMYAPRRDGRRVHLAANWNSGKSETRFLELVLSVNRSEPCERPCNTGSWLQSLCVLDRDSSCNKSGIDPLVFKTSRDMCSSAAPSESPLSPR